MKMKIIALFCLMVIVQQSNSKKLLNFYQFDETQAIEKGLEPLFHIAKSVLVPTNISKMLNYSEKFRNEKIRSEFYNDCVYRSPHPKYYDERNKRFNVKGNNEMDRYIWKGSFWSNHKNLDEFDSFIETSEIDNFINNMNWFLDNFKTPFQNSGKFYYPPKGVREWHTNSYQGGPGWRLYVILRDSEFGDSGINVIDPETKELIYFKDLGKLSINIFRITDYKNPTWHCVYSKDVNRYSFGIKITDKEVLNILKNKL
jgi:hypothetical protein